MVKGELIYNGSMPVTMSDKVAERLNLGLPADAPDSLVHEVVAEMQKLGDSYHLKLVEQEAAEQEAIKAGERGLRPGATRTVIRKEESFRMTDTKKEFPYLLDEDVSMCVGYRLSEDEFLSFHGGLKGYLQHRLARDKARSAGFDVPRLSGDITDSLEAMEFTDLDEKAWAKHLVDEQREKVQGIIDSIKTTEGIKEHEHRLSENAKQEKAMELRQLQEYASKAFGWGVDSPSARDWAVEQQKIGHPGVVL